MRSYLYVRSCGIFIIDAIFVRFKLLITSVSDTSAYTLARRSLLVWGAWGCWNCTLFTARLDEDLLPEDESSSLLIAGEFSVRVWTNSCSSATLLAFSFFAFFFLNLRFFCASPPAWCSQWSPSRRTCCPPFVLFWRLSFSCYELGSAPLMRCPLFLEILINPY